MPTIYPKPFQELPAEEKLKKLALLDMFCFRVWEEKLQGSGRLQKGFISHLIKSNASLIPSLTRDALNNALRKYAKVGITSYATFSAHYPEKLLHSVPTPQKAPPTQSIPMSGTTSPSAPPIPLTPSPQKPNCKGGIPEGSTIAERKNFEKAILSTLNEIAEIYDR